MIKSDRSADVLTRDRIIDKIATKIETEAGTYIFDASGMIVSAGLVDAHVHMEGPEADKYGINVEMSAIPFGVTAVADAGDAHGNGFLADNRLVKNVTFVGVTVRGNVVSFEKPEEKLPMYQDRIIGLKIYFDTNAANMWDIKPLQEVCDYASRHGLLVMVHCSNSPVPMDQILATLRPGDILTHAFHGGEHSAAADGYASMQAAKQRGVVIDAGFAGHIHTDFSVFRGAVQRGVLPHIISTDITRASAYKRGGRYGMTMCMSMARTAGMEEIDIFRAVTTTPAKVLRKEGQWGCLKEGDRVCALLGGGGYAQYVAVKHDMLMPVPKGLTMEEASALPEAYATSYLNLFIEGQLQAGQTAFVPAGASGLASVAIPMAKAFGARVITSVLSDEIAEKIKHLGADVIINSSTTDVAEVLAQEEQNGTPVSVSMDCLSGETLGKSLPYMARGGYWVVISTLAGIETTVQLRPLLTCSSRRTS